MVSSVSGLWAEQESKGSLSERELLSCCLTKQQMKPDGFIYGQLAVCCDWSTTDLPNIVINTDFI